VTKVLSVAEGLTSPYLRLYSRGMIQRISETCDVVFHKIPISLTWFGRTYPIIKLGLHHTYREGLTRHHIFSVVGGNLFFRLNLNTDTLSWTLEEVSDGLPD